MITILARKPLLIMLIYIKSSRNHVPMTPFIQSMIDIFFMKNDLVNNYQYFENLVFVVQWHTHIFNLSWIFTWHDFIRQWSSYSLSNSKVIAFSLKIFLGWNGSLQFKRSNKMSSFSIHHRVLISVVNTFILVLNIA
jgi:hypothetical protein